MRCMTLGIILSVAFSCCTAQDTPQHGLLTEIPTTDEAQANNTTFTPGNNNTAGGIHYDLDDFFMTNFYFVREQALMGLLSGKAVGYEIFIALVGLLEHIVCMMGMIGNILTICVLCRKALNDTILSVFLRYLAMCDLLRLITNYIGINHMTGMFDSFVDQFDFYCRLSEYIYFVSWHLAAWALIPISLERFTAVYFPFKVKLIFTRKLAWTIIISMSTVMLLVNLFIAISNGVIETEFGPLCFIYDDNLSYIMDTVFVWVDFVIYFVIPFSVIVFCNVAIIRKIVKQRSVKAKLTKGAADKKVSGLTWVLLFISLVYLICTCPGIICLALINPFDLSPFPEHQHPALFSLLSVVFLLASIHHSINFLLYCVTMPKFRAEFVKMLCCVCVGRQGQHKRGDKRGNSQATKVTQVSKSSISADASKPSISADADSKQVGGV